MKSVITILLIILFIVLIVYQLTHVVEGLETEYKDYPEDPMILAKQNAGNIQVLKQRLDELMGLKGVVDKHGTDLTSLKDQMDALVQSQLDVANSSLPEEPPNITGIE